MHIFATVSGLERWMNFMINAKKKEFRVIIAGGRTFTDYEKLSGEASNIIKANLDALGLNEEQVRIISGHAAGTDSLGERFATESGFNLTIFPANWVRFGKPAGCIRNQTMVDYATEEGNDNMLIAFWNGTSRGTRDMIDRAEKSGMDVFIVAYTE